MKFFAVVLFLFSFQIFAQAFTEETNGPLPRPIDVNVDFNESMLSEPWIKEFHYVVVVNKADRGAESQSIKVYEFGKKIIEGDVSTGRDQFEKKGEHNSKRDSWTVTPTGYYTPTFLDKDHRSSAYGGIFTKITGGVKMPFAIFFNGDIALHQAPRGTEDELGTKASGGCVRLPKTIAEELFNRINEVDSFKVPNFSVNGTIELNSRGEYSYREKLGFSALIIVINKEI